MPLLLAAVAVYHSHEHIAGDAPIATLSHEAQQFAAKASPGRILVIVPFGDTCQKSRVR